MPTPLPFPAPLKMNVAKSRAQKLGNTAAKVLFCAQLHDLKVFLLLFQEAISFQILVTHEIKGLKFL